MRKNPETIFIREICSKMVPRYIKRIAHVVLYSPVFQGHVMELQRGRPFAAANSIEKSPLLACIQGRVAAKDDDHFATVRSVDETNRQPDRVLASRQQGVYL
jgi:hypothetical protein